MSLLFSLGTQCVPTCLTCVCVCVCPSAVHGARQEEVIDHRLTDREWAEEWKHLDNVRVNARRDPPVTHIRAAYPQTSAGAGETVAAKRKPRWKKK